MAVTSRMLTCYCLRTADGMETYVAVLLRSCYASDESLAGMCGQRTAFIKVGKARHVRFCVRGRRGRPCALHASLTLVAALHASSRTCRQACLLRVTRRHISCPQLVFCFARMASGGPGTPVMMS